MKHLFTYKLLWILFICIPHISAQQLHHLQPYELIERQWIDDTHAENFARIQVQDFQGRIKPIHTLSLELLRKIYGKSSFTYIDKHHQKKKLSPTQVFLGMQYKADSWQLIEFIKIEKKSIAELRHLLRINTNGYTSASQFFDFQGNYKLKQLVADAFAKAPGKRSVFDKNIIKIDERINIVWGVFNGQFLKIFPKTGDPDKKWFAPTDINTIFENDDQLFFDKIIPTYLSQLSQATKIKNWNKANETIELLKGFQTKNEKELILSSAKVDWELWFNKNSVFFKSMIAYTLLGIVLLILSFINIFGHGERKIKKAIRITIFLLIGIFLFHVFGIVLRSYISGHAPWSNGYEASVFISCVTVLAGLVFSKKNSFAPAVASILAMCLLGIAHGSLMNPEITNLVPVLKSYWLIIHVAVITGSYGFLALGSLLALIVLIMMSISIFRDNKKVQETIQELTTINQLTSTLGLYMLTIGTFLGGIWANESWGRYWGWDPKETWALISVIIYSFVLHIRIIFPKNYIYLYNVCSFFALASILMTFFGVNYYLSGLHSYAKGDPFPVPNWIYIALLMGIIISVVPLLKNSKTTNRYNEMV
ncbi:cytochrome c biogenesis protein [Aquimarina sp. RZ0]|uniref:cytochrome c biogenesis protein n=1 Tax=Aquimarina sp. RZ0 TaxID=2607730 RepID=UPI0011F2924C|nr:cytochrome c biogenesis protein CcsA [Aquimarina sp. RZ0]KAA1248153.1 cytochrome C biogenesis protein [Aquimarina sp. RZ0]